MLPAGEADTMPQVRRLERDGGGDPRQLVVFWRLRQEEGVAEAVAWSHPDGAELRILADGRFVRSRVFSDLDALVDYVLREQARLERRGWIAAA
jgi:hypothetical protein